MANEATFPDQKTIEDFIKSDAVCGSFGSLREAHHMLKECKEDTVLLALVPLFLQQAAQCGKNIEDLATRSRARSIIAYWRARLASLTPQNPPRSVALQAYEHGDSVEEGVLQPPTIDGGTETKDKSAKPAESQIVTDSQSSVKNSDPRPQIGSETLIVGHDAFFFRFAAAARLWRDTSQLKGFLLEGEALKLAKKYRGLDKDINALVDESEKAISKRRSWIWVLALGLPSLAIICLMAVYSWLFPLLAKWEARRMVNYDSGKYLREWEFSRISFYQRFMPASDIAEVYFTSGIYKDIDLERISLPGGNFVQSRFKNVEFDGAKLPNAIFVEVPIMKDVDFVDATLVNASFRGAGILEADFTGAQLYRAIFDNSALCDVNFSGADLRKASFRDVTIEKVEGFFNSGWWLASGWSSANYLRLLTVKEIKEDNLKVNTAFKKQLGDAKDQLLGTEPDSYGRANALNQYALTLATWGYPDGITDEAYTTRFVESDEVDQECKIEGQTAEGADLFSRSALGAARQAVCILGRLPADEQQKQLLEKSNDTLGYVYLQKNLIPEAIAAFELAANIVDDGGRAFRYSIALQQDGKAEAASRMLGESLKRYAPSHELWTLRSILFTDGKPNDYLEEVFATIDRRWPSSGRTCEEAQTLLEKWN